MTPVAVTVLAGGFGGAKMSHGLALEASRRAAGAEPSIDLSIVVNTGDDLELHGLTVCPDLDTVMYTLAGLANDETGWGVRDETWNAAAMLERYGAPTWFRIGDRDLATHVWRTQALRGGARLTDVTAALAARLGVGPHLLPMADEPVRTRVRVDEGWLDFQDYFVRRGQRDRVLEVARDGIERARPTPDVLDAVARAALIVLAPSNPFVSIGTILALPGITDAILAAAAPVVAVSPVVSGAALRGPADRMLESLGWEASARGFVRHYVESYPGLLDTAVVDVRDTGIMAGDVVPGVEVAFADTVMRSHADRARLARELLDRFLGPVPS
jgi:LPPG:FO 2-phospho-L-lactate transferase